MPCPRVRVRRRDRGARRGRAAEVQRPALRQADVLFVHGEDVRALPLKERKALLEKVVRRYGMQKSEPVLGDGRAAFRATCGLDLEGIVAKRLADAYEPGR